MPENLIFFQIFINKNVPIKRDDLTPRCRVPYFDLIVALSQSAKAPTAGVNVTPTRKPIVVKVDLTFSIN